MYVLSWKIRVKSRPDFRSVLWCGPSQMPISVVVARKTINLVSAYILITWQDSANLVRPPDAVRPFCNLKSFFTAFYKASFSQYFTDCTLKQSILKIWIWNLVSVINIDNPTKCLENATPKIVVVRILECNLQARQVMSIFYFILLIYTNIC